MGYGDALYRSRVLADSPVAFWPLQEAVGSSTAEDATGNGHTGNWVDKDGNASTAPAHAPDGPDTGVVAQRITATINVGDPPANPRHVEVADAAAFTFAGDFALEWIARTTTEDDAVIRSLVAGKVHKDILTSSQQGEWYGEQRGESDDPDPTGYYTTINGTVLNTANGSFDRELLVRAGTNRLRPQEYHHVGASYKSGIAEWEFTLDGVLVGRSQAAASGTRQGDTAQKVRLGLSNMTNLGFRALDFCGVAVYDRVLTTDEFAFHIAPAAGAFVVGIATG